MALDMLMNEAKGMSDGALMEVVHFMQFIKITPERSRNKGGVETAGNGKRRLRRAGLYQGKIKMSEDFDAPLYDFKEYTES